LQSAYGRILSKPVINIQLTSFHKPYFLALGEVDHPGKYDLQGATSVTEAVAVAGGLTKDAKHSEVLCFRRVNANWASIKKVDLKQILRAGNLTEDLYLHPGEMVYVPKNTVSKLKPFVPYPSLGMMLYR